MAVPVRSHTQGATSKTASKYDKLFEDEIKAESLDTLDPKVTYEKEKGEYYDGLMRESVFSDKQLAPTQFKVKKPLDPEVSVWDDIKAAPAAALRGFTQGMAVTADLLPTTVNALAEYGADALDVVTGQGDLPARDFDNIIRPWALSGAADEQFGTVDSYEVGAVSEIASNVAEAVPMVVSMGAGMARYGASTMMKQGAVNPLLANYTLKFSQSLGIDTAAIAIGETVEEIVETVAGEDSGWALAANITTSILGGWKLSQSKFAGASDDVLKAAADEQGVVIASKSSTGESTLKGPMKAATKVGEAVTKPLSAGKTAVGAVGTGIKKGVVGTVEGSLNAAAALPFSKNVFREFKEANGSFSHYLKEQDLLSTSNRGYMKAVMDKAGKPAMDRYAQNLELATHLNLKLDTYQLTGMPEFKDFSLAVQKLNPSKALETLKHNIDMVDDFLKQKGLGYNEFSNNTLQNALKKHHGNTEASIASLRETLVKERDTLIKTAMRHRDPAKVGKDFLEAYTKYERNIKDLVGRGFEKAIPKDTTIDTKFFNNHVLSELTNLKTEGIIPANIALPKIIRDMMEGTAVQTLESGVRVTPKITAKEMHESIVQLKKARKNLIKSDPSYNIKDGQLENVVGSMEDALAQKLSPEQFKAYNAAKNEYHDIIGAKFNQEEVKKYTLKDGFNKLKSNGQDLIRELLSTQGSSESRVDAINKLLTLSHQDMMKMAHRIDDVDVKNIDDITAATDVMHLKIKDYIVNDYMTKVLVNPKRNPVEIMEEYVGQHGRMIHSVLNEPLDLNKMAREVQLATKNNQMKIDKEIANQLDIGAKGERKVEDWLVNDLIKNTNEVKRFNKLMNDPDKLKAMGMKADDVRDTLAGKLVEHFINRDSSGSMTSSTLFDVLKKKGKNIEEILGKERMEHLKTFERGFGLTDMIKKKDLTGEAVDLDRAALNKGAMRMLQRSLSTHLMVQHGFVSKTYAYGMRAIQVLGGLKNDGYKKFMSKMMTDPNFFKNAIGMVQDVKTHDDIVRARLVLAHHFGIPTETMDNEEANQQARSLMDASVVLENSVFKDFETEDLIDTSVDPVIEAPLEAPLEPVEQEVAPSKETTQTKVPNGSGITNVPTIAPSDPTNAISTRKPVGEIREG